MSKKPQRVSGERAYDVIPPERRGDACLTSIPVRIAVACTALLVLAVRRAVR